MFTLAHLSDIHLTPTAPVRLRDLRLKRLTGLANWHRKRKAMHLPATLEAIVRDMLAQRPDHIAVTGDLVNIGLPQEHIAALDWLKSIAPPAYISVVPGNHDVYVRTFREPGHMRWRDYMVSNFAGAALLDGNDAGKIGGFPYARQFGDVLLVGLCSGVPKVPFVAAGRLGSDQLALLAPLLAQAGRLNLARIVLIHHPPLPGQATRLRGLEDADDLAALLNEQGAELVLHGHNHQNSLAWCPTGGGAGKAIPVVGVASASMGVAKHEPLARYNLYRLQTVQGQLAIEIIGRGLMEPGGPIVELERKIL